MGEKNARFHSFEDVRDLDRYQRAKKATDPEVYISGTASIPKAFAKMFNYYVYHSNSTSEMVFEERRIAWIYGRGGYHETEMIICLGFRHSISYIRRWSPDDRVERFHFLTFGEDFLDTAPILVINQGSCRLGVPRPGIVANDVAKPIASILERRG